MHSFNKAFREWLNCHQWADNPILGYHIELKRYEVFWFFSPENVKRMGWEIIHY